MGMKARMMEDAILGNLGSVPSSGSLCWYRHEGKGILGDRSDPRSHMHMPR